MDFAKSSGKHGFFGAPFQRKQKLLIKGPSQKRAETLPLANAAEMKAVMRTSQLSARGGGEDEDDVFRVPLDLYKILKVPRSALPEALTKAFNARMAAALPKGLSDDAIQERKDLLQHAYSFLTDSVRKKEYDQSLDLANGTSDKLEMSLPRSHLHGALILLLECKQNDDVIRLGKEYLELEVEEAGKKDSDLFGIFLPDPDVVDLVALAQRAKANRLLEKQEYDKAGFCLEQAITLLHDYHKKRTDPMQPQFRQLEEDLGADLVRLRPGRIMELVSLDTSEGNGPKRDLGKELLREWVEESGGIGWYDSLAEPPRDFWEHIKLEQFVGLVRPWLFIEEQEAVFVPLPRRTSLGIDRIRADLLVAEGFVRKDPGQLVSSLQIYERVAGEHPCPYELSMLSFLMNDMRAGAALFREAAGNTGTMTGEEEAAAVRSGMVALARWLTREVLRKCRDYNGARAVLMGYFQDTDFQERLRNAFENRHNIGSATDSASVVETAAVLPQTEAFVQTPARTPSPDTESRRDPRRKRRTIEPEVPAPVSPSSSTTPGSRKAGGGRRSGAAEQERSEADGGIDWGSILELSKMGLVLLGAVLVIFGVGRKVKETLTKSTDETEEILQEMDKDDDEEVAPAPQPQTPTPQPVAERPPSPPPPAPPQPVVLEEKPPARVEEKIPEPIALEEPKPEPVPAEPERADSAQLAAQARSAVLVWQNVKAAAMGPARSLNQLDAVLVEPALSMWRNRANTAKNANWHWIFKLQDLKVDKVDIRDGGKTATVDVTLQEAAQYFNKGVLVPSASYDKSYRARYGLSHVNGQWKIRSAEVLR